MSYGAQSGGAVSMPFVTVVPNANDWETSGRLALVCTVRAFESRLHTWANRSLMSWTAWSRG